MALEKKIAVALPPGKAHRGVITRAHETETDFGNGAEATVRLEIQPAYQDASGTRALPVQVNFSPNLTGKPGAGMSALAKLFDRFGYDWDTQLVEFEGGEIIFDATAKRNGFINVEKDTIVPATPKKPTRGK